MMIAFVAHLFLLSLASASSPPPQPPHGGFSVELIHIDSPKSPFHNPSKTPSQLLAEAVSRSTNRVNHHFKLPLSSPKPPQPPITLGSFRGDYIINFSLGTPPTNIVATLDTGSELIWTQCNCTKCYKQKGPYFNPSTSSTYKPVRCNTPECSWVFGSCDDTRDVCKYSISYKDETYSNGDLATDTLTLGSTGGETMPFDNIVWGCGRDNTGQFRDDYQSGVFGLGAAPASLIIQKGSSLGGRKFSYCFAPSKEVTSTLSFGNAGVVSGPGVVSTPLIIMGTHYKALFRAISVGNERFEVKDGLSMRGNMFVDSGVTVTYLPDEVLFDSMKSAVEKAIGLQRAPGHEGLYCYYNSTVFEAPNIAMHFDGADLELSTLNTFLQESENTTCFAFKLEKGFALLGNTEQNNFLVGYDLEAKTLSFKSTDCSK